MKRNLARAWLASLLGVCVLGMGVFVRAEFPSSKERVEFTKCSPEFEFTLTASDRQEAVAAFAQACRGRASFVPLALGTLTVARADEPTASVTRVPVFRPSRRPVVVGVIELRL